MSEPVLKAIIRLFALVAKEDQVTQQEREYIQAFLADHLSQKAVGVQMTQFDEYAASLSSNVSPAREEESIKRMCQEINQEVAQKQKMVIMLELMSIILADGTISAREEHLAKTIGAAFNVSADDISLIKTYVSGQSAEAFDHPSIL